MGLPQASALQTAAVIAAEQALTAAHRTFDLATIARLLHPDYVIAPPSSAIKNKAQTLAPFTTGDRHWDIAESVGAAAAVPPLQLPSPLPLHLAARGGRMAQYCVHGH